MSPESTNVEPDRFFANPVWVLVAAIGGVLAVGALDYLTGYEVSVSAFYLGPVAFAAWHCGRWGGISIALLSCVSWFVADTATGHPYSAPLIPVWNAVVRFAFYATTALLLVALRTSLRAQQVLASTDALTGLCSRRVFDERLGHDLALAQRRAAPLTLAYLDVDEFKRINSASGHAGGDKVLRVAGRVLRESLRATDTAARVGGDEFALILPDTDGSGARRLMTHVAQALRDAFAASDPKVTFSVGVVTVAGAGTTMDAAIAAADEVMYQVKRAGKGAVRFRDLAAAAPSPATTGTTPAPLRVAAGTPPPLGASNERPDLSGASYPLGPGARARS